MRRKDFNKCGVSTCYTYGGFSEKHPSIPSNSFTTCRHLRQQCSTTHYIVSNRTSLNQVLFQASAVKCLIRCMEWFDDDTVLNKALPNVRPVLERHYNDLEMSLTCLSLFESLMPKVERSHLTTHVIPSMLIMKLGDASVMERFVSKYGEKYTTI